MYIKQLFAAPDNMTGTAQIQVAAREIDFVSSFQNDFQALQDILGITRPIRKANGSALKVKKASGTLQSGHVAEGDVIPASRYNVVETVYDSIEIEKYRKAVSLEAISDHGYEAAIAMTDEEFKADLRNVIMGRFYDELNDGTLLGTESTFQMAFSMAIAKVKNKFKSIHKSVTRVAAFINIIDAYKYIGAANITVQTAFGMSYIENFLGAEIVFLGTDADGINQGVVYATPVNNIVSYYVDPGDSEFVRAGLSYTVQGETSFVGFHTEGNYERALSDNFAIMGLRLFAEYLDGIAKIGFGASGVGVAPETSTILSTNPADIQSNIVIKGGSILGTSKWLASGTIPTQFGGAGNFLALKFTLPDGVSYSNVKVGVVPTAGTGMVALDSDLNAVLKITNKNTQNFVVEYTADGQTTKKTYDMHGLVCEEAE